jgi:hypothetical protein
MDERDFYNPIKNYFEKKIANNLGVSIKLIKTHDPVPKDIGFAHPGIKRILKFYAYEPDLFGVVLPGRKTRRKVKRKPKLILIKIRTEPLKLLDFFHLRLYSEIIKSDFSFLVSSQSISKKAKNLMREKDIKHIKYYYLKTDDKIITKEIIVGKIDYKKEKGKIKIIDIDFDPAIFF